MLTNSATCEPRPLKRRRRRAFRCGLFAVAGAVAASLVTTPPAGAQTVRTIPCSSLRGSGTYASPYEIGNVQQKTVIVNCNPLSFGPNTSRIFAFGLTRPTSRGALIGSTYQLAGGFQSSPVPSIINPANSFVLKRGLYEGARFNRADGLQDYAMSLASISAIGNAPLPAGRWYARFENVAGPFASAGTPFYNITIIP